MQPTQKLTYLACIDCGRAFEVPSAFGECKACANYADSWAETQLDRYLSANEDRDLAESGNTTEGVSRTLRDAALYLSRHGWCQGAYYDQTAVCFTPAACMVGAIAMVCYGGPVEAPALMFNEPGFGEFEAAVAYLDLRLWVEFDSNVYEFNDVKGRTADDIIRVLTDAADQWTLAHGGAA